MVEEKRECDTSIENLLDRLLPFLPKRHYQDDRGCTHVLGSNLFARQTASLDTCWSKKEMSVRVEREHMIERHSQPVETRKASSDDHDEETERGTYSLLSCFVAIIIEASSSTMKAASRSCCSFSVRESVRLDDLSHCQRAINVRPSPQVRKWEQRIPTQSTPPRSPGLVVMNWKTCWP